MSTPLFERWADLVKSMMWAELPAFMPNTHPYKDELPYTLKYLWVVRTKLTCMIAFHYLGEGRFDVSVGWTDVGNSRFVLDQVAVDHIPAVAEPRVWVRIATLAGRTPDAWRLPDTGRNDELLMLQAINEVTQYALPYLQQKIAHFIAQGRPLPGAQFIPYSKMPTRDYGHTRGTCYFSMDAVLERTKTKAHRRNARWEGPPYRILIIELSNGQYAKVYEEEIRPNVLCIELHTSSRSNLMAVATLLGLPLEMIDVCTCLYAWRD